MAKRVTTSTALPQSGDSYTRNPDTGALTQQQPAKSRNKEKEETNGR